ncbi:bifunctional orotidine-5'-phosphate decarboxylase/orotate phosphoribosyltransferase [Chroococcidiopsis sp. CCNUC1]|jgi:uridine monophosphate synthetase|uniref:bifunctional orotidine-5'-phosphate decarboxylase/orotate phosphoribosyltransferase n=1 Tax=Chroococcidiopsis sp. CCNUC1 TaxID=2653189 RepID=UPI000D06D847|nr:bifunctional orotidine-5'-phosphate decarboxylase/orotate phosphoribosyltransferase [Chroococcidiopsis sp. CCNUC1]PSB46947.1 bifunctional orotidine-5'-phosphate decarboxylase/orotate phosphoribosyltransferase [Cyanosarcina cf. burmensis CCALA 770]URD52627.1 bifunctional orotidine-5'-phosphate decarboxylase/orotate phosphoribosyltransferase [Chroococcidiopsis sp. CCNUC1]
MTFFDKLNAAIARNQSLLFLGLDPNPEMMPSQNSNRSEKSIIDDLGDWLQFVIAQTTDLICAYKPTLGFYQALGVPGIELLERTLKAIPENIPIILDAKHSDLNTSTIFAQTVFERWRVDAVTLSPYPGQDCVAPFLVYPGKGIFILCCTSNPGAIALQQYPSPESPFYLQIVKEAKIWGTPEQVCLEVGTTSPDVLAKIRAITPERTIMARSIWAQASNLPQLLAAGLNSNGSGLLVPVPQDFLSQKNPATQIQALRQEVEQARTAAVKSASQCDVWFPNVCLLQQHPHTQLILQLYDLGCIIFGNYVQASGAEFPYYIDLRTIISNPQVFEQVLNAYAEILQNLNFDRIAGIPYGSLPTATGLALRMNYPMIFPRKEVKAHGTRRVIEGHFQPGETVVVVDDILISGKSAIEGAGKLKSAGLNVEDIVVFIDHEEGVRDRLKDNGYRAHAVLKISEITQTLYEAGKIDEAQYQTLTGSSDQ